MPNAGSTLTTSRISVIVSTYERPDALHAVLRGLSKQLEDGFEVIVADDGSGPKTAEVVAAWQSLNARVLHVWHRDDGFRLAEIRNRAVAESSGDYLIFLDGDCIPRQDFVAMHQRLAEPGWIVCGHRLMLPEGLSRQVVDLAVPVEDWTVDRWFREWRRGSIDRLTPFLRLPGTTWRRHLIRRRTSKVRGCNMALWHSDFLKVDGFDAELVGWGHEDNDLATRLQMVGVRMKDGRWATGVLHLWHEPADRSNEASHWERIAASIGTGRSMAVRGFSSVGKSAREHA